MKPQWRQSDSVVCYIYVIHDYCYTYIMISVAKIGMKLSTIRERMLSRIVSSTFMAIFVRNSSAVLCNMYDSL